MTIEKKRSFIILGVLIALLCFTTYMSLISPLNTSMSDVREDNGSGNIKDIKQPKRSATYTSNLTVDNAGAKNWAWAVTQDWCSGSGTFGDPYLIDDHIIQFNNTLRGEYACINISNSHDVYFKISNCNVRNNASDFGIGIALSNCTNGIIDTVICSNNGDDGIYIINSMNITIDDSIMNNNHNYGLNMDNITVSTITTTTMNLNTLGGASLINCTYNIFQTACNFNNDTTGITLIDSDLNNITACNFHNDTTYGLEIYNSDSCIIINNDIEDNGVGIYIYDEGGDSEGNELYGNDFDTNTINAQDNSTGTGNTWDNGVDSGNQWGDYSGADLDDDGIGDDPYDVSGSASAQDNYPVWDDGDSIAPVLTIISPTRGIRFIYSPQFSLIITEAIGISVRWYTLDSGTHNTTFSGTSGTISFTEWDRITGLPGQIKTVIITFYANDTSGNEGATAVSVQKYFLPAVEHGEDDDDAYMYSLSYAQIYLLSAFAFALSLSLRLITLRGKKS